ncbi:MAG: hypothetical protein HETSPECPRED_007180 [Heterodermia speciosa]|uniref:Deacetylase sirtuin-type domain-containing protein n=1 Tax=Heterodermia speciosa TaxID=116794 RepID=A0A8H3HYE7_9LECA|nr:MAG: hypothetical protein HETSPECPRED_007180 [Heterodermia speciosa]
MSSSSIPKADLESFSNHLKQSRRILALLGAGLSASSGLPTFRGTGGLWRSHEATSLATPEAFAQDAALVWQFYSYRRHMALQAQPNLAHHALAALARRNPEFITLSQNVDGLSQRAGHRASQLHLLHGSLFDVRCTAFDCDFIQQNNFTDPIVPALAIPREQAQLKPSETDNTGAEAASSLYNAMHTANASSAKELDISDDRIEIPQIPHDELPHCPQCGDGLLRPGVVWFGETLPRRTMAAVDAFIDEPRKIDLILVVGTSAKVYPAAGYVDEARAKGAKVAVVNMDRKDTPGGPGGLQEGDWFFEGDASKILPEILKPVIGDISRKGLGQFPAAEMI